MIVTRVKESNYESFHYLKEFTSYYRNDQDLQDAIEKVYETYKPLSFKERKERFNRLCENKTLYLW